MNYPALSLMLGRYTLSVNRAKSRESRNYNQDGYEAYVQPAFGAASGIDHEVWAETFEGVLEAIDQSIAAKWYPHLLKKKLTIDKIPPILLPWITTQGDRLYFRVDFESCGPQLQQAELDDTNEFLSLLGLKLDEPQLEHDRLTGYIEELKQ